MLEDLHASNVFAHLVPQVEVVLTRRTVTGGRLGEGDMVGVRPPAGAPGPQAKSSLGVDIVIANPSQLLCPSAASRASSLSSFGHCISGHAPWICSILSRSCCRRMKMQRKPLSIGATCLIISSQKLYVTSHARVCCSKVSKTACMQRSPMQSACFRLHMSRAINRVTSFPG